MEGQYALRQMKKLLYIAIAYQIYLVTAATGAGSNSESLLAGRAIAHGQVPYRDFMLHVGPLLGYVFAIPKEAWVSLLFIAANLATCRALFLLAEWSEYRYAVCALFLLIVPVYGGNLCFPEVVMSAFGTWGLYYVERNMMWQAWGLFVLAILTKQTGVIYPLFGLLVLSDNF